jgi:hypothetical protein
MVTPHALLPTRKIVDRYLGKVSPKLFFNRCFPALDLHIRLSRRPSVTMILPELTPRFFGLSERAETGNL